METKHTPGPWVWGADECGLFGTGPDHDYEVLSYAQYEGMWLTPVPQKEANARLIAASPKLLSALLGLFDEFGDFEYDAASIMAARDAIYEATGSRP